MTSSHNSIDKDLIILQVGYVANVPYFLCYGLKLLGIPCYNIIPASILRSKYTRIFYGSIYNRNPLNVNLIVIDDNSHYKFMHRLISVLYNLSCDHRYMIIHLHIGSALRDHVILKLASRLINAKIFVHMHGTDLRNLSHNKAQILKSLYEYQPVFVSTPDLLVYCKYLNLECIWIHNPVDPIILKIKERPWEASTLRIFIPTRFDASKGLDRFFDLLIEYFRENPEIRRYAELQQVIWPNTASNMYRYVKALSSLGMKVKLLPLLNRRKLIRTYLRSNVVIGQFIYGIPSLTELEALATQNYVIMKPLENITRYTYLSLYGVEPPVSVVRNVNDIKRAFSSSIQRPNSKGKNFVRKVADPYKVCKELLKYYLGRI